MGSDKSRSHYQGLLLEDERVTIWDAETTASESGPRAGVPQPLNLSGMSLQTYGSQSADKDLRIRTQRGGFAEPDGAGFVWKNAADTNWRGHDVPGAITHYQSLKWSDFTAPLTWYLQPHSITLGDGSILVAYYERDDSEALPYAVGIGRRSVGPWTYTRVNETVTAPVSGQGEFHPCLLLLPSGRVLLFHWVEDLVRDECQIRMWYSDDDGVTWAIGQDNVLDNPVSTSAGLTGYDCRRIRMAEVSGQILMMVHLRSNNTALTGRDLIRQYASADEGNSFDSIEEWNGTTSAGGYVDVVSAGGHFVVGYIQTEPLPYCRAYTFRLGNAYQPGLSVTHFLVTEGPAFGDYGAAGPFITDGDLSMASTPQGTVYITGRATANSTYSAYEENNECVMLRSDNFGKSWLPIGQFSGLAGLGGLAGVWYNQNKVDTCPRAFAMTWAQGRMAVFHNWRANPGVTGTIDEVSLSVSYLGGSSTVTMPGFQRFQTGYRRVNFEDTYLPFDLPSAISTRWSSGWNKAGAGTEVLTNGYLKLGDGSASAVTLATAGLPAGHTIDQGIILQASMSIEVGGSSVADDVAIRVSLDDGGANGYDLIIRYAPNEVYFIDGQSGATIGIVALDPVGNGVDLLLGMASGTFSVWMRPRDDAPDRDWQIGPTSTALTNTGGGGASSIIWGHHSTSGSISRWHSLQSVTGTYTGLQIASGQVNPNDLMQHSYSDGGTYVTDGVFVSATDGPTIRADEWKIVTRYDFPLANLLDSNPRKVWKSTGTAAQTIGFQLSILSNVHLQSDLIGIALYNCNFPFATLEGYDSTTSTWTSLGSLSMFANQSALTFQRDGDTVGPTTANATDPTFFAGEMEGALWSFASSGHKIKSHLTGKWSNANTRPISIVLDSIDGTETATGNGAISSKDAVFLVHLQGSKYQGFRVSLFAPGGFIPLMADPEFQIGRVVLGPVVVHGDQTSWGRIIESNSGTEVQEARDRTIRSRKIAPTRRIIEYGWTDAVDTTAGINPTGNADPDFVDADDAASSLPVALKNVAPYDFEGIYHLLSGPNKQVVYLPRIEKLGLTTIQTLNRRAEHALCRITSPVRVESVQGEELDTEVMRVATVTFQEDV